MDALELPGNTAAHCRRGAKQTRGGAWGCHFAPLINNTTTRFGVVAAYIEAMALHNGDDAEALAAAISTEATPEANLNNAEFIVAYTAVYPWRLGSCGAT